MPGLVVQQLHLNGVTQIWEVYSRVAKPTQDVRVRKQHRRGGPVHVDFFWGAEGFKSWGMGETQKWPDPFCALELQVIHAQSMN